MTTLTYYATITSKEFSAGRAIYMRLALGAPPPQPGEVFLDPEAVVIVSGESFYGSDDRMLGRIGVRIRDDGDWPLGRRVRITITLEDAPA